MATELKTKFKEDDSFDCFDDFNPNNKDEYNKTIINWSNAISEFLKLSFEQKNTLIRHKSIRKRLRIKRYK